MDAVLEVEVESRLSGARLGVRDRVVAEAVHVVVVVEVVGVLERTLHRVVRLCKQTWASDLEAFVTLVELKNKLLSLSSSFLSFSAVGFPGMSIWRISIRWFIAFERALGGVCSPLLKSLSGG